MAQATVGLIAPRAAQQREEKQKEDPIETLMKGLQIANGVLGIGVNFTTLQNNMGKNAIQADERSSILPGSQRLDMQEKGFQETAKGTPGAQDYKFRNGDTIEERSYLLPAKESKTALQLVTERGADGTEISRAVDMSGVKPGDVVGKKLPLPDKAPKDITIGERNTLQSRYDRDPVVRRNRLIFESLNEAKTYMADPSPASDHALVIAYFKANDPTSIVKETEAETAQALGGLQQRAEAWFKSNAGEAGLTDAQRADLVHTIELKAQAAATNHNATNQEYLKLAKNRGVSDSDLSLISAPEFENRKAPGAPGSNPSLKQAPAAIKPEEHPQAQTAAEWAKANISSQDPATRAKAQEILKRLGATTSLDDTPDAPQDPGSVGGL